MKELIFPRLRQTYDYDCGASALQSVLVYYGIEIREEFIIKYAHTNNNDGTSIKNIEKTVKKYKLRCISKTMTISDIKKFIDKKIPVIVVMQAWTRRKGIDWKKDWNDGHYVVVIGYDKNKLIFEDPSSFERTYLPFKEFDKRWHDTDNPGTKYIHHGIAIFGKKPKFNPKKIILMK